MSDDSASLKASATARFNTMAAEFDEQGAFAHFGRRLVEVVGVEAEQRVLDVATGRGAVLFPAAEHTGGTGEVLGVDLAENMVRAVNEETERRGLGAPVRVMDAEQLDFPDAAFERVLCGFGLMFFPHQNQAVSEFRRVLKPAGRVGASTWRASQAEDLQAVLGDLGLLGDNSQRPPGWIAEPAILADTLERAGFLDVRVVVDPLIFRYGDLGAQHRDLLTLAGGVVRRGFSIASGGMLAGHPQRCRGP